MPTWGDLGQRSNSERVEYPSLYILQVAEKACEDLGIDPPQPGDSAEKVHSLIQKFVQENSDPFQLDEGRALEGWRDLGVIRIKRVDQQNSYRGATWVDAEAGVVWLLRAIKLGDFPDEESAYAVFDRSRMSVEEMFPAEEERTNASDDQILAHHAQALRDTLEEAFGSPDEWYEVKLRRAGDDLDGGEVVGHCHVEQIEIDGDVLRDAWIVTRYGLDGANVSPNDWIAIVIDSIFPQGLTLPLIVDKSDAPAGLAIDPSIEVAIVQKDI